jgi:uncharacterized phage protein (TIGR01671 family)
MRPIEFRAWDLIAKEMIYLNEALCSVPYYEIFCHTPDDRPWDLMEFTGLFDKNEKKIFESDIIELRLAWNDKPIIALVKLELGTFIMSYGDYGAYYTFGENPKNREVLGNLYENIELLNPNP